MRRVRGLIIKYSLPRRAPWAIETTDQKRVCNRRRIYWRRYVGNSGRENSLVFFVYIIRIIHNINDVLENIHHVPLRRGVHAKSIPVIRYRPTVDCVEETKVCISYTRSSCSLCRWPLSSSRLFSLCKRNLYFSHSFPFSPYFFFTLVLRAQRHASMGPLEFRTENLKCRKNTGKYIRGHIKRWK